MTHHWSYTYTRATVGIALFLAFIGSLLLPENGVELQAKKCLSDQQLVELYQMLEIREDNLLKLQQKYHATQEKVFLARLELDLLEPKWLDLAKPLDHVEDVISINSDSNITEVPNNLSAQLEDAVFFWPWHRTESGLWILQLILILLLGYENYRRKAKIIWLEALIARQNKDYSERERKINDELRMYSQLEDISYNAVHVKNDVSLGEGGHGKVYEGLWQNNIVAVKKYNINRQKLLSVIHEASLIAQLKHDHIVKSFGVVVPEIMVVFEKMDQSLHDVLHKATLHILEALQIALDVARALDYIHSLDPKVIHRDVKPENIMLCSKNKWLRAKLADFGVARFLYNSPAETITGTVLYLAPEIKDEKTHTEKADIYSYGMTMLQVINNFKASVQGKINEENALEEFQKLIDECKNDDPEARPTATEIIDRLEKMQRDVPSDAYQCSTALTFLLHRTN
eukprot:TRINITY_DN2601_c0_g1_i1.p1 TRINITY_DN2601_c0_g1~~TRINITY_DN2601_c0_g1_i1.p1  ORF type:complete len:457 (-),score=0.94 TRINITY_DN2601_c0_g1_i1:10-1380(-)